MLGSSSDDVVETELAVDVVVMISPHFKQANFMPYVYYRYFGWIS
jgi:hypothetical protein